MKSFINFTKKECIEHIRSAKIYVMTGIFILTAIISPMFAKLTPVIVEMLSDSMAQGGMEITVGAVSAIDSWLQFLKNAPIVLIAFILLESNIFTKEYQRGTLVLALTKGLNRNTVLASKTFVMLVLWTVEYFICFGIVYVANDIIWDNSVAQNLMFTALCWWVMGVMVICLSVLFSVIARTNIVVLAGTGSVFFALYLIGMLPKIDRFMPTLLMDTTSLIYGLKEESYYVPALVIAVLISVVSIILSVPIFNKKRI